MKRVLVTGGTVFVSKCIAEHYVAMGDEVYVLNRNHREQPKGVKLIQADRQHIGDALKNLSFDLVVDTGYTAEDVEKLLDALGEFRDYVFISSSAVYPDYETQPFTEATPAAGNRYWAKYGQDKIEAEQVLLQRKADAYILRPPYLYGPANDIYREAFVFDCAMEGRPFYLPQDGDMQLQFFHIQDLCRFIDILLKEKPTQHIFNVGNEETVSIREWVRLCYEAVGKQPEFVRVKSETNQSNYFSFCDYQYILDVTEQKKLMPNTKSMAEGLSEAFAWYCENRDEVERRPFMEYIDTKLGKALFEKKVIEFVNTSELNYISKEEAMDESLEGLRIYAQPIFGYADAKDPLFDDWKKEDVIGSHVMLPREWLTGAKTVISYFLPFTEAVKKSNRVGKEVPSYEWLHGRIEGQRFMLALDDYVKKILEEDGFETVVPEADERFQADTGVAYTSNWSERHAAYVGGLGTFGLSKGLITEKGIAGRFGSVITKAEYEPLTRKYTGIYDYCTKCGACVRRCPVGAITLESGKEHPKCSAFLRSMKEKFAPRLGCGKCQTAVPCENGIPNPKFRKQ